MWKCKSRFIKWRIRKNDRWNIFCIRKQKWNTIKYKSKNDVRTSSSVNARKADVSATESPKRETRQFNSGLRDLVKILLIRELLNRPRPFPPRPPVIPPMPPGPGPRPPRPPFGPGEDHHFQENLK